MPRRTVDLDDFDFSEAGAVQDHPQDAGVTMAATSKATASAHPSAPLVVLEVDYPETVTSTDLTLFDAEALQRTLAAAIENLRKHR